MNFCTSCGRPREAGDAFCAHCGAPTTVAGAGHSVGVLDPQPVPPEGGGGRRNAGVIWAIVGTVVLALGIGGFAVWKVFFATSSGADSPDEAVREVLAAAEDQDPIAALGMINPGESRGADEVWEALHQRLERAGVTTKDGVFDAAGVSFEDVELEVDEVADHVAKVHLREGTVKLSLEADDFPKAFDRLAAEARAELGDSWTETYDIAELADEMRSYDWEDDEQTRMGLFVMVIEVDGRWYVSPTATWTEYAAHQIFGRGGDWSAYDEGVDRDPVGGERPEEALRAFAEVANSDDLEALLDGLPHGQGDLFRPFVGLVEEELARYGAGFDIELRDQTVRAGDEDDGLVRLDIDRIELGVTGVEDGDPYRNAVGLDGSCGWAEAYDGSRADGCVPTWLTQVSGIDNAFVMVRETDDVWQIDLFATAVAWLEELATNVPDDELDSLVAAIDEGDGARWLEHRLG